MSELWLPLAVAFVLSVGFVFVVRPAAQLVGAVATPKADRWHRGTIPLLGGVAISAAFPDRRPDQSAALPGRDGHWWRAEWR
ncbi:MAG: hypothetical protein R2708_22050 [Vicinamibacterales bacterium]